VHVAAAPTLAVFASGKLSGLVVDVGGGKADICPVFEGVPQAHASRRLPLGGQDATLLLHSLLSQSGVALSLAEAEEAKQQLGFACASSADFCALAESTETLPFPRADGAELQIPRRALAAAGELLFDPHAAAGLAQGGIAEEIMIVVARCDKEVRKAMLENVILCGGAAAMGGFEARLISELAALCASNVRPALVLPPEYLPPGLPKAQIWFGGAILGKTVFPINQFVSRELYAEKGPQACAGLLG